jgi:hypothetical protein
MAELEERVAQGLPLRVEDPAALAKVARVFGGSTCAGERFADEAAARRALEEAS